MLVCMFMAAHVETQLNTHIHIPTHTNTHQAGGAQSIHDCPSCGPSLCPAVLHCLPTSPRPRVVQRGQPRSFPAAHRVAALAESATPGGVAYMLTVNSC